MDGVVRELHESAAEMETPSHEFEFVGRVSCSTLWHSKVVDASVTSPLLSHNLHWTVHCEDATLLIL